MGYGPRSWLTLTFWGTLTMFERLRSRFSSRSTLAATFGLGSSGRGSAACLLLCVGVAALAACSGGSPNTNTIVDMGLAYDYKPATISQINADPGNGPYGNAQRVVLERVVAVTKVDKYVNSANQQCRYQIWVQDPLCTTPPCGLVIKAIGPMAPSATASGKDCPSASTSGTLLDTIGRNDNVRVRGKLVFEVDNVQPMTVVEHQLFVETLEILSPDATITPTMLTDSAMYNQFVTHLGQTWNKYEGMLVTLAPTTGTLQVTAFDSSGFNTNPGGSTWGDTFDSDYYPAGATTFPTVGSMWKSITAVVSTRHGGELMPLRNKDFVP